MYNGANPSAAIGSMRGAGVSMNFINAAYCMPGRSPAVADAMGENCVL